MIQNRPINAGVFSVILALLILTLVYAAFGRVVSGMEAVDEIASIPTDYNDRPKIAVRMKRVYIA